MPEAVTRRLRGRFIAAAEGYFSPSEDGGLLCVGETHLLLRELLKQLPHRLLSAGEAAEDARRTERLLRLIAFVENGYAHKLRLADFAEAEGCSLGYMSHFAREMLGRSFQEYVESVRFNAACKLISAGEDRMLDVSVAAGFSDYRYFSRAFRRRLGMTPEQYSRLPGPREADTADASGVWSCWKNAGRCSLRPGGSPGLLFCGREYLQKTERLYVHLAEMSKTAN